MEKQWRTLTLSLILVAAFTQVLAAKQTQPVFPDLQVSGLSLGAPAILGCGSRTVTFTVTETNARFPTAAGHLLYLEYNNGSGIFSPVCAFSRPSLAGNTSRVFTATCTFWNGPCGCSPPTTYTATFRANIDPLNTVTETNEGNNLSNTFSLPATCP